MAISVTALLTQISNCDSDDWVSGVGAVDTDTYREGSASLCLKVSATTSVVAKYDQNATGVDMSGQHFYVWFFAASLLDTVANGGLRIYAEDTSGNWAEWYIGGSDNYGGGWQRYCVSADDTTAESKSGTYDPTNHRYIGVRFKTLGKSQSNNCWWDDVRYGSGLKITSGATDAITWDDIYNTDSAAAHGIVTKKYGIYFVLGELQFGDITSGDIDFEDEGQLIMFPDVPHVESDFYKITIQGNASGAINFQWGSLSGSSGVQGCIIKSVGSARFDFIATDTDIDILKLYGSTFLGAGTISLPTITSSREVVSCNFDNCNEIQVSTCTFKNCVVSSAPLDGNNGGLFIPGATFNVTDCSFIGCARGVRVNVATTYDFTNLVFSGNTYDISNTSDGAVTINKIGTSDPITHTSTGAGSVSIQASVYLTVYVKDENNDPIGDVRVYIERASDNYEIMNTLTDATYGKAQVSHTEDDIAININIRKSSTGTRYYPVATFGDVTVGGFTLTQVLIEDKIV